MAKGYIIGRLEVTDPDHYATYTAQTPGLIADHGGRFLVRGGPVEALDGDAPLSRNVVIEFPSLAAAKEFFNSEAYQKIIGIRHSATEGHFFMIEGAE